MDVTDVKLAVLSNLEPRVMPVIVGHRVVERYSGSSDSIIQQQVRILVEGFERFTKRALKEGSLKRSKGVSLNINNFKFEYDQSEMSGGSVDILYVMEETLLGSDISEDVLDWFTYFIKALDTSSSIIHSSSAGFYDHLESKQIQTVRTSLKAIKGMAIENEKLVIETFGNLSSPFFSIDTLINDPPKTIAESVDNGVEIEPEGNPDEKSSNIENEPKRQPEESGNEQKKVNVFTFEIVKAVPAHTPEINSVEGEISNARIIRIDIETLSITFRRNSGGAPVAVQFNEVSEFNDFFDRYPDAPKRDHCSFNVEFLRRNNGKNSLVKIEEAAKNDTFLGLFSDAEP
ncbi:hypothetical protein [Marinomonas piezotolerans]|nr:hypothetical protein [Marinomonas piezotolerans]